MSMLSRIRRKRFGEILVGEGLISKDQLDQALAYQKSSGDFLGSILLEMGSITETDIIKTLSAQYQIPFLRPSLYEIDRRLLQHFTPHFLHAHKVLPIDKIGNLLLLLVTDIPNEEVLAEIQTLAGANLAIYIGSISEVDRILTEVAPLSEEDEEVIREKRKGGTAETVVARAGAEARKSDAAGQRPAVSTAVQDPIGLAQDTAVQDQGEDTGSKSHVFTLDSSWESIFDEAEGKLRIEEVRPRPGEDADGGDDDGAGT